MANTIKNDSRSLPTKNTMILLLCILFSLVSCEVINLENEISSNQAITVSSVDITGSQITITGSGLNSATSITIQEQPSGPNSVFNITSKSNTSLLAEASSMITISTSAVFNLLISSASAQATFPVTFTLPAGSVQASHLSNTGANDGDVFVYDSGSSQWVTGALSLDDLSDVDLSGGFNSGDSLEWNGSSWAPSGGGGGGAISDKRFKKNISTIENSLDKLSNLEGVSYDWRKDEFPKRRFSDKKDIGLIAQEVQKVFPEAVDKDKKGFLSVRYHVLMAPVINSIKELNEISKLQQEQIKALMKENKELKKSLCESNADSKVCH